jgi:radical SAM superfamily enzyme YgiQ (UPF0313 family)
MRYKRVLILNFPKIALDAPPLAPALLSSICDKYSIDHDFIDCNLDFHQQLAHSPLKEEILGLYCEQFVNEPSEAGQTWINQYFLHLKNQCRNYDLIAISVFSIHSVNLVHKFLSNHRNEISADIVVGGAGIKSEYRTSNFYQYLKQQNLIDYWILGEGEIGFGDLLTGSMSNSINNTLPNNLENFDHVPVPNFDKFRVDSYRMGNKKIISVEGSRGCVKKCTFCDIQNTWGAFKYKQGKLLAEELLQLREKYNPDHFWFNDSLINGSGKAFREFIGHLAQIRKENSFTWSSQAIVRNRSSNDEEDFRLMKLSGCETLATGLESFSQSVRWHMGKKFTDDDLDHFLNLAQKYNISIFLMMVIGYPTETQEDFEHSQRQLKKYQHLADDGTIAGIRIGGTMSMIPSTPIYNMAEEIGITYDNNDKYKSVSWVRGENTLKKRVEWRVQFEDYARQLGYQCYDNEMSIEKTLLNFLSNVGRQQ